MPGTYTLTFTLSGMQTATRRSGRAPRTGHAGRREAGRAAASRRSITVTAAGDARRQGVDGDPERHLAASRSSALPVDAGLPRSAEADPRRHVHAGHASAARAPARSGQDNVYMFDGVNVTMPLFGMLIAEPTRTTSRRSRHQGRREGDRLQPRRRLPDRLGQQVGHEQVHRRGRATRCCNTNFVADAEQDAACDVPAGSRLGQRQRRRTDPRRIGSSSTVRTTGRSQARQPGEPLRRAAGLRAASATRGSAS